MCVRERFHLQKIYSSFVARARGITDLLTRCYHHHHHHSSPFQKKSLFLCVFVSLRIQNNIKIIFFIACALSKNPFPFFATTTTTTIFLCFFEGKGTTKRNEKEETNGYGHTKRKAPLLARSVKLSLFGLG